MNAITDDEIGAMFRQDLRRRTDDAAPPLDLDAVIRGGRRRIVRGRALVAVAATGALGVVAAITLPAVIDPRTAPKSVSVQPAASEPPSTSPSRESYQATARRIRQNLYYLLLDSGIHPSRLPPTMNDQERNNPPGVYAATVDIDRVNGAGNRGVFVTVQTSTGAVPSSAAVRAPCTGYRRDDPPRSTCTTRTLPDGTVLEIITNLDANHHSFGGVVSARHPDGVEVLVATTEGEFHRWPSGVNIAVLQKLASSPLLTP